MFFDDVRVPADQLSARRIRAGHTRNTCWVTSGRASRGWDKQELRLAEVKKQAKETGILDDPLFAARLAEAENELLALELTQARVVSDSFGRPAQSGVVGAQAARQPIAAGGHRTAGRGGRAGRAARGRGRHFVSGLGTGQRAALPQLAQG